jgi:hypothetical protein
MQKYSTLAMIVVAIVAVTAFGLSTFNLSQQQAAAVTSIVPSTYTAPKLTSQNLVPDVAHYDVDNLESFTPLTEKDLPSINGCVARYKSCEAQAYRNFNSCMGMYETPAGQTLFRYPDNLRICNFQRDYELRQCSNALFECLMPLIPNVI